jgi:uncharacterized membrane protein
MVTIAATAFGVFLLLTGIAHLAFPAYFRSLVPGWFRRPGLAVIFTGLLEAAIAVLILLPHTRQWAAWAAALLISAYLPVHLEPLRQGRRDTPRLRRRAMVAVNIGVNLGYIAWALWIAIS